MPQGRRSSAVAPPPGLGFDPPGPGTGGAPSTTPSRGGRKSNPRAVRQARPAAAPPAEGTPPPPPPPGPPKTAKQDAPSTGKKSTGKPKKKKAEGGGDGGGSTTPGGQSAPGAAATPSAGQSRSKRNGTKALYDDYLTPEAVAAGVAAGALFLARLRCNAADRTQGFATLTGLPRDVFIPGWRPQNRAIEGDEVALRLLPLSQWRNQAARGGPAATPSRSAPSGNVLPFSPPAASRADALTAADGGEEEDEEGEPEVTSGAVEGQLAALDSADIDVEEGGGAEDDLVSSPALLPSPSGGELPLAEEQAPLGLEGLEEGAGGDDDLSMVGFLTQQLAAAAVSPPPPPPLPVRDAADAPWTAASTPQEVISIVSGLLKGDWEGWRATAEVVAIVAPSPRRASVVGVLRSYGPNALALVPRDQRLPRCLVPFRALEALGRERAAALAAEAAAEEGVPARTLLSAHILSWAPEKRHPAAALDGELGAAGGLQAEVAALLTQEGIEDDDAFTPAVLDCLPATPWAVSPADLAARRDLRGARIFSIDPPTARDLDDALSVEDLGGGSLRIGVHIADVSHFVRPGTALDAEAAGRATSVYLVDRVIPMLPRLLCEELCSLNPGVDRLAFSIVWTMDAEGVVHDTWAGRTVIRSCAKLSYPQVQGLIDGTTDPDGLAPEGVALHGGVAWADVAADALALHGVASARRRRRFEVDGALRLDNVRLFFELDGDGNAVGCGIYEQKEANRLVEEFMLAANMTAAQMISEAFPDRALLRRHPPPDGAKLAELGATVARLLPGAPHLDPSSAGALQASLAALRAAVDPAVGEVVTLLCTKPMKVAQYFCTGDFLDDNAAWRHYALAVQHYTHFTSPIRRYPDVMVHRLLQAALDKAAGKEGAGAELAAGDAVGAIAARANDRKAAAKAAQDGALKLYLASMLLDRPVAHVAVVVGLGGPRYFDAYVPALGVDVRVHVDRILAGGEAALDAQWSEQARALSLACRSGVAGTPRAAAAYDDVESFERLANPEGLAPVRLPLTLRALDKVPLVVGGARSKVSGSPTGLHAKLYVAGEGGGESGPS